jgi:mycothiol synthase
VCEEERWGVGWVASLGVRRPWRRRGLGQALLLHSIGELYDRGRRHIGLGVDVDNPTDAPRLYERAGMHVASSFVFFERELVG